MPGGAGMSTPAAAQAFMAGTSLTARATMRNYPAPLAILTAVYEGTQVPIDTGLRIESQQFGRLLAGPVARNLMRTMFVNKGQADKLARRPVGPAEDAGPPPRRPGRGNDGRGRGARLRRGGHGDRAARQHARARREGQGSRASAARTRGRAGQAHPGRGGLGARAHPSDGELSPISRAAIWSSRPCSRTARSRPR